MDVVNGRIVETVVRAAGETTATTRAESRVVAVDHNYAWRDFVSDGDIRSGVSDSSRRAADQQELGGCLGQGGDQEWAPSWAPSSCLGGERMTPTPTFSELQGPRNYNNWQPVMVPERTSRAGDFAGLQQAPPVADHRPGWNRCSSNSGAGGIWGTVRVENGQIVEFARPGSELGDHALGLKPSRARVEDAASSRRQELCFRGKRDHLPGSFVRAVPAAPSWAGGLSSNSSDQPMASWGRQGLAPTPAPARLISDYSKPRGHGFPAFQQQQQQLMHHDHRQGWKRSHTGSSSALWSSDQCLHHFDRTPCSEGKLDEEMTLFESQITRTVSGHFSDLASSLDQDIPSSAKESAAAAVPVLEETSGVAAENTKSSELKSSVLNCKRKSSELPDGVVQITRPLKLLLRKGLTVSDVGELGRIVVPKKDAESRSFPKIDTKEGTVLEMEDYIALKRWYFRFKYWINNKSRMYVLENTGDFIKYHSLKENDIFIVYESGCKKLVVCGQKKGTGRDNLDPLLESPASETQSSPKLKAVAGLQRTSLRAFTATNADNVVRPVREESRELPTNRLGTAD